MNLVTVIGDNGLTFSKLETGDVFRDLDNQCIYMRIPLMEMLNGGKANAINLSNGFPVRFGDFDNVWTIDEVQIKKR